MNCIPPPPFPPDDFPIQTRSELGGIRHWPTLAEAMSEADIDSSVWKISFTLPSGERCRLVRQKGHWFARFFLGKRDTWVYESIWG